MFNRKEVLELINREGDIEHPVRIGTFVTENGTGISGKLALKAGNQTHLFLGVEKKWQKKSISQSIRFPPFDSSNWIAEALPITKKEIESTDYAPNFTIETDDGWLIEQSSSDKKGIYEGDFPKWSMVEGVGWHLVPNNIHQRARNLIRYSVAILLISLLYLAFTPLMEWIGIPTFGTRSVRLGLLDYPLLATIVVPMRLIPILMRIGANFHDLRRQNSFLKETPPSPEIEIEPCSSDKNLVGKISFQTIPEEWGRMTVSKGAGILSPVREAIMSSRKNTPLPTISRIINRLTIQYESWA